MSPSFQTTLPDPDDSWALFLDVDGTLIEFADTPEGVRVDPRVHEILLGLEQRFDHAVALVSGRSIEQLDHLFAPQRHTVAGIHGLERRGPDGRVVQVKCPTTGLDKVRASFLQFADSHPETIVEDKGMAVALHFRRAPELAAEANALANGLIANCNDGLVLQHGKMVVEFRPRGPHKGDVVDAFMAVPPYHLIPLAQELRKTGAAHPMVFFLHTPLPPLEILVALPHHDEIMSALCAFDLIGFQTVNDLAAFQDYVVLEANGEVLSDGVIKVFGRTLRADVFAIGIDTKEIIALAAKQENSKERIRLDSVLRNRAMIIGVDRLDYSKGLVERFRAFERMLELNPRIQSKVTLLQIAPPSRSDVGGYNEIRTNLETTAGNVNGRFADFDWVPIRYLNRSFERSVLTCFYRAAKVGLVTPLRDGMNLVAKEYVASQAPDDPGVLVLSRFAGAAHELDGALRVNPYDTDEVANAMNQALNMPLDERIERHVGMIAGLLQNNVHVWRRKFLAALKDASGLET